MAATTQTSSSTCQPTYVTSSTPANNQEHEHKQQHSGFCKICADYTSKCQGAPANKGICMDCFAKITYHILRRDGHVPALPCARHIRTEKSLLPYHPPVGQLRYDVTIDEDALSVSERVARWWRNNRVGVKHTK